jgi:glycosyltransferase involved in cell wall biosynthesis
MKLLLIGASTEAVCGTRDYARTLEAPLRRAGADVRTLWWERGRHPLSDWLEAVHAAAAESDAVLWQYSVFTYASRGLPTLVPRVLRALRTTTPLITVFHELVFPWGTNGVRGAVHAVSHRAALVPILRASRGVVVTTEERRAWLESRPWLPSRPVRFLPVVSNVATSDGAPDGCSSVRVGVFGFRRVALPVETIVDAVRRVPDAELVMVGAPGAQSVEADRWRSAAGEDTRIRFTGVLDAAPLAAELAALDIVVFPDPVGPTTRRGTLAAALAHGKPVVAFDGPQTWSAFVRDNALLAVRPTADALAGALDRLAGDRDLRGEQGRRAQRFHDSHLSPDVVARGLVDFACEVAHG